MSAAWQLNARVRPNATRLLAELEAQFGPQRFLNTAAAFDGVKDYVAQRTARRWLENCA